jgi:glycerophosphoryl diester phosphodiesterase
MKGRVSLVAHRGQPLSFPENSLAGYRHAVEAGANYVETDVQICADGVPVLSHDANLLELSGKQIIIGDHDYSTIARVPLGYSERFGDRFADFRIATLKEFAALMADWSDVTCFVELKQASLQNFGMKAVELVIEQCSALSDQLVLISFSDDALEYARARYPDLKIGWVLPEWDDALRRRADDLEAEYLFIDEEFCPGEASDLWSGDWRWVAYTINSADQVAHCASLGIELIETDRYSELVEESDIVEVSTDF